MEPRTLKELRFLRIYAVMTMLAFAVLVLAAFAQSSQKHKFGEIDVERINVVDEQGRRHLVISSPGRFPDPVINGQELKGKRSIKPAGLVFFDDQGNEVGGIGMAQTPSGKLSVMAFDYALAEAIGFNRFEGTDGKNYSAGFSILDPPPPGTKVEEAASKQQTRVTIQNENKDAQISLADAEGRRRIRLLVDRNGDASIQILDKNGKVVFAAPNN